MANVTGKRNQWSYIWKSAVSMITAGTGDHWDKDAIGVSYTYLKNLNIAENKPYSNDKCIIRRGIIVTSPKK